MDMMAADASASDVSDKIKEILYAKTAEKVDAARPLVGAELFGDEIPEVEDEPTDETEVTSELETEVEPQEEEESDETVN
mgnify:FL=1